LLRWRRNNVSSYNGSMARNIGNRNGKAYLAVYRRKREMAKAKSGESGHLRCGGANENGAAKASRRRSVWATSAAAAAGGYLQTGGEESRKRISGAGGAAA
jgi:hypothetical protein